MANYMQNVNGVNIEMNDEQMAFRVAEEKAFEDKKPAKAFSGLRSKRNEKLAETDHYALSDRPLSDDMTAYRKALRDLPAQYDNSSVLGEITWPTPPE